MNKEFWESCVEKGCVILPIKLYANFNAAGNLSESDLIGIKYVALPCNNEAIGPDYWFMIDEGITGRENYYNTPERALERYQN